MSTRRQIKHTKKALKEAKKSVRWMVNRGTTGGHYRRMEAHRAIPELERELAVLKG